MSEYRAWKATADVLADLCPNGTANEIKAALERDGVPWAWDQIPELVDETLEALAERGKVEVIWSPLLS